MSSLSTVQSKLRLGVELYCNNISELKGKTVWLVDNDFIAVRVSISQSTVCFTAYRFKQSPSSIFANVVLQQPVPRPCWNKIRLWHCAHCWETNPDNYTSRPKVAALPSIHPSPVQASGLGPPFAPGGREPHQPSYHCSPISTYSNWPQTAGVSFSILLTCTLFTCCSRCNSAGLLSGQKKVCGHNERQWEGMRAKGRYFRLWRAYTAQK